MNNSSPGRAQFSTAFLLAQVGARAAQEFARLLAPLKLSPADAGILRVVLRTPGISQQNLAKMLGMHASRLVSVIDALQARGLILREPNLQDRRLYSLRLTTAGDEMMQSIGEVARSQNELMCAGLEADERAQLTSLLEKIAARHGLAPGIHPGYRDAGDRSAS
jgi:DNA-binding MarR family transcriptional regulator